MKIQLDTTAKTIKIEEDVKFSKLIETLKRLLPNNEWKEFTLETHTVINHWNNPYVVYRDREVWPKLQLPWYDRITHYAGADHSLSAQSVNNNSIKDLSLTKGVFNIEA